jgi:hypothetical protein
LISDECKKKAGNPRITIFFVTLEDFSAFLCIKAVWEIEDCPIPSLRKSPQNVLRKQLGTFGSFLSAPPQTLVVL